MEQLTIEAAAERPGLSEVTVGRRLTHGHLAGEQVETPRGDERRACLEDPTEPAPGSPVPNPGGVAREAEALRGPQAPERGAPCTGGIGPPAS